MTKTSQNKARCEKLDTMISSIEGFNVSRTVSDLDNRYRFLVDNTSKRVCILANGKKYVCGFDKIINVEYIENGETISSKSTIRTIGGALAGSVLAGGVGAIVGGLSGKSKTTTNISTISVKVTLRDYTTPSINIVTFDCKWYTGNKPLDPNDIRCRTGVQNGKRIVDFISIIIDEVDRDRNEKDSLQNQVPKTEKSENSSLADEIKKLAELKEKGHITEDEFYSLKQNLLSAR